MKGCSHKTSCPLFSKFLMKGSLKIWKVLYCDTEEKYKSCARFTAGLEGRTVSPGLLPNGEELRFAE